MDYDFELPISAEFFRKPGAAEAFQRWTELLLAGYRLEGELFQTGIQAKLRKNPKRIFEISETNSAVEYRDFFERDGVTYLRGFYRHTHAGKLARVMHEELRLGYRVVMDSDGSVNDLVTFDLINNELLDNIPTEDSLREWGYKDGEDHFMFENFEV